MKDPLRQSALRCIILLGLVSLFADMTYEGARSITGPYLGLLGASATIVGIVAGFGEFLGYALRLLSGYLADKTGSYWILTIVGYVVNLLAVPFLAVAGRWETAALLIIAERTGKAIRTPPRDVMLSHANKQVGQGWGFGFHHAMDQTGAVLGPLIIFAVFSLKKGYSTGFQVLVFPAFLALSLLMTAKVIYPNPRDFEPPENMKGPEKLSKLFWIYTFAAAFIAAGYADFSLMAYHFKKMSVIADNWIPLFYTVAMGTEASAAFYFGRLFDRIGIKALVVALLLSSGFAPLVFLGSFQFALLGIVLWGLGMGAQESIMRAAIAKLVPAEKRGVAYGTFNSIFGLSWFLGSALMGRLYDVSLTGLIIFSILTQLAAISLFYKAKNHLTAP